MKDQNKYQRPSPEQWEIMKRIRRETNKAGLFRLDVRAKLVQK